MPILAVADTQIYYEDAGNGPALLLLHGWGTSARVWHAQQAELRSDHRVVSIDWRGCGRSEHPATGNDIHTVVADLVTVITTMGIQRPIVLGSSIGAVFATELALAHPDLVSAVVAVSGPAYWPAQALDLDSILWQLRNRRAEFLAEWVPNWFAPGAAPALVDWTVRQLLDAAPYIDDQFIALSSYDPRPQLGNIEVPVHYIHGELDAEIPVAVAQDCARRTPGAHVAVLTGCGHLPHQEQPAEFNTILRRLVSETLRPALVG